MVRRSDRFRTRIFCQILQSSSWIARILCQSLIFTFLLSHFFHLLIASTFLFPTGSVKKQTQFQRNSPICGSRESNYSFDHLFFSNFFYLMLILAFCTFAQHFLSKDNSVNYSHAENTLICLNVSVSWDAIHSLLIDFFIILSPPHPAHTHPVFLLAPFEWDILLCRTTMASGWI